MFHAGGFKYADHSTITEKNQHVNFYVEGRRMILTAVES